MTDQPLPPPLATDPEGVLDGLQAIADLVMRLSEVERATHHPNGRPETVTTHTVMLALVAATVAQQTELDPALMMGFALVHDLTEAHTGDVDTIRPLDDEAMGSKVAAEVESLERIQADGVPPWIVEMVQLYEAQERPEARTVRILDKLLPRLTNTANGGRSVIRRGIGVVELGRLMVEQDVALAHRYPELLGLVDLLRAAAARSIFAYGAPTTPPR